MEGPLLDEKSQGGPRDSEVPFGASVGHCPSPSHEWATQDILVWFLFNCPQEKLRNLHHILGGQLMLELHTGMRLSSWAGVSGQG